MVVRQQKLIDESYNHRPLIHGPLFVDCDAYLLPICSLTLRSEDLCLIFSLTVTTPYSREIFICPTIRKCDCKNITIKNKDNEINIKELETRGEGPDLKNPS